MTTDEKIIFTVLFTIFTILVNIVKHMKGANTNSNSWTQGSLSFFLNKDGTEKRFTKLFFTLFFLFWILIVWVFG